MEELRQLYDLLIHNLTTALKFTKQMISRYQTLTEDENYMDLLEHQFRENYFHRITANKSADVASSVYVDILGH